jgi:predicted acylesterase/phospholipase RssA
MQLLRLAIVVATACLIGGGCSSPRRLPAVPHELADRAIVPGVERVRFWGGEASDEFVAGALEGAERERAWLASQGHTGKLPTATFLAVSGGGQNGAFGAGLLCGWTDAGTRPEFKLVTGISTGALIAPFAFLGPEYDHVLREVYTTVSTKDILKKRGLVAALTSDAMADTSPLWDLVRKHFTQDLLADIAREHAKGRELFIGTTNLDERRPVLWNVGKIASVGTPEALDLVRSILIASASIPGAFPPVMIDVEVDGEKYEEMHVDGGAMSQVFVYPAALQLQKLGGQHGMDRERAAYIIRNARLDPEWAEVERRTLSIVGRAISSMIQTQGIGDLYRIYATTQRDGVDFNLAFIPPTFTEKPDEEFDPAYMTKLFDLGYQAALSGYPWQKTPPAFGVADP